MCASHSSTLSEWFPAWGLTHVGCCKVCIILNAHWNTLAVCSYSVFLSGNLRTPTAGLPSSKHPVRNEGLYWTRHSQLDSPAQISKTIPDLIVTTVILVYKHETVKEPHTDRTAQFCDCLPVALSCQDEILPQCLELLKSCRLAWCLVTQ